MAAGWAAEFPAAAHTFVSSLDDALAIGGSSGHHLERVRRLRAGEVVTAADGCGGWRPYAVVETQRGALMLEARGEAVHEPALVPTLAVAFALTKGTKPDLTVQKLTELGVDRIVPMRTHRSVPRWDGSRVERLRRVAWEAACQCRRACLPEVAEPRLLDALYGHPGILMAERDSDPAGPLPPLPEGEWLLVVGPEGGFDPAELDALADVPRLRLGPYVLRSETAAIAGAAALATRRSRAHGHAG